MPEFSRPKRSLLYIDDSSDDRELVQMAIDHNKSAFTLYTADGAESAVKFFDFRRHDDFGIPPRPQLVLLDYDLGNHTGSDFLFWLRVIRKITATPVVMYSGSVRSVAECYEAGATHFLQKPQSFEALKGIIRTLEVCMFSKLPRFGLLARLPEYVPVPSESPQLVPAL